MKKQLLTLIIMLIITAMGLTGCINEEKSSENQLSNLGYSNTDYGFGLNPPDGWVKDNSNPDLIVGFNGPTVADFTINMVITAGQLDTGETPYMAGDEMIEAYPAYFTDFTLVSRENRTINNMNAYEHVYTHVLEGSVLKQKQVLIEKNGKALILTFSANTDSYDTYNSIFEESVNSVKITWS